MGAPFDPVGDFCYARITKDTDAPGTSALFGQGGIRLAFVGASKRYMVDAWSDGEVDVVLTVRNVGDAALLWWHIQNLGNAPRPLGLLFGMWPAQHSSDGHFDSQTGANQFFAALGTNFGINKLTSDLFTGYAVAPTIPPVRIDYHLARTSARFPEYVDFYAGQTENSGLHITNVPDASMQRIPVKPLIETGSSQQIIPASTADLMRIGPYFFSLWDNNMNLNVFGDNTGTQETADINVFQTAFIQRYPVTPVSAGGFRDIVQVIKSSWGVSDYNDPYAAVVDAPKLINSSPTGQDGLTPNPMRIRAYVDNQYAVIDKEVTLTNVRVILTLPPGLSLAAGETAEKTIASITPDSVASVEWSVVSDGVTFGDLPISVTFSPTPGQTKVINTSIMVAATPKVRIASGAQMVTFPYDFSDNSLGAILGLTPEIDFRAFKWDPGQSAYIQASTATRGEGVWIVSNTDHGFVDLNGASRPADTGTGGLLYAIHQGWNMIGNPYNYPVRLSEIIAVAADAPANSLTWSQLVNQNMVSSAVATWNKSGSFGGHYDFTTSQTSFLFPHKAYWIFVNTFNPIYFSWRRVMTPGLSGSGRAVDDGWRQTDRQWRLQLSAQTNDGADLENYIAYTSDPSKVDQLTIPKPPAPLDSPVEVVLEGTFNGQPNTSVAQAVTTQKSKTEWHVHVNAQKAGDVTLTWPNLSSIPRNVRAKITDLATNEVRDLRTVSGYTFFMSQPGSREFVVTLEQGGAVRPVIGNVVVSGSSRDGRSPMTISYALSADAVVSVRILSATGKEVFTVTRGRADNAGQNQVTWNLHDNANRAVAPGTYRVEILAETPSGDRVRRIVPINVIR
ncbi:MAG TPA: FlgD immunoglobulin-like domain containing protein [Fimbriimonadaceae bacterium]|nr:FlgD immunoglobulin-like domain containing protein [Fimbriimonadaceae bacterium]